MILWANRLSQADQDKIRVPASSIEFETLNNPKNVV